MIHEEGQPQNPQFSWRCSKQSNNLKVSTLLRPKSPSMKPPKFVEWQVEQGLVDLESG
jgi:hypothetical protein